MLEIFASLMLTWNHEIFEPVEQVISCWSEIHDSPQQVERFCFFFFFSAYVSKEHSDIVKCVVCYESRVYSGG